MAQEEGCRLVEEHHPPAKPALHGKTIYMILATMVKQDQEVTVMSID